MIICHLAILHYNMSFQTIAGRSDYVWWFPALSEDQEKICRIHPNYLVALIFVLFNVKGEVSTDNNVDWVSERKFFKPNNTILGNLDDPRRTNYAKFGMSHLWTELLKYVIPQKNNSWLCTYIFTIFLEYQLSCWSSSIINTCTIILVLTHV